MCVYMVRINGDESEAQILWFSLSAVNESAITQVMCSGFENRSLRSTV